MKNHADQILARMRELGDPNETLEDSELPVEAILAIGPEWKLAPDNFTTDAFCGCCDSPDWCDALDSHYNVNGPSVLEYNGHLYVLGGNWKYPIYFRFDC